MHEICIIMVHEELLREIGLSNWETRVYIALLELGSTTTGPLVKKCGVERNVYFRAKRKNLLASANTIPTKNQRLAMWCAARVLTACFFAVK